MNSEVSKNTVLDQQSISRKIKRMVLEIAETNTDETEILIAAVNGNGEVVAAKLLEQLRLNTHLNATLTVLKINKKDPIDVSLSPDIPMDNKAVLLVDDVANTGKTMMYALKPFLQQRPKKIQTLVLVERSHKLFPIQTDFAGLSIATTLQEHITVETAGQDILEAWLS